jgi:hypothetical protein
MLRTRNLGTHPDASLATLNLTIKNPGVTAVTVGAWNVNAGATLTNVGSISHRAEVIMNRQVMTDITGPKKLQYNQVSHTKLKCDAKSIAVDTGFMRATIASGVSAGKPIDVKLSGTLGSAYWYQVEKDYGFSGPTAEYLGTLSFAVLKAQAEGQMAPGAPPQGADVALYLAELTDFTSVFRKAAELMMKAREGILTRTAQHLSKKFARAIRDKPTIQLAAIVHSHLVNVGINAHLAWKLVYEPLIRDSKVLADAIRRYDDTLRKLQLPKAFRVYGRAESSSSSSGSTGAVGHSAGWKGTQSKTAVTWALVRQAPLFNVLPSRFFREYYGLTARVSTVWETIPLTFIADMFVDIGQWLRQFDGSVYQIPFELLASGHSQKTEWTTTVTGGVSQQWQALFTGVRLQDLLSSGDYSRTAYTRVVGGVSFSPSAVLQPLQIKLPNLGQLGTIAELVYLSLRGR